MKKSKKGKQMSVEIVELTTLRLAKAKELEKEEQ